MTDKKATSLDQLSRIDKEAVRSRKTLMLDLNLLELPKNLNIRYAGLGFDEYWAQPHVKEYVSKLARDYAEGDIFPPIVVSFNPETQKAIIIDGAHRYLAIKEANENLGAEIVRHAVTDSKGDEAKNILLMINTGQRLDVSAVEIAEGLARLDVFGFSVEEIAQKVGKTVQYVYYMRRVNGLSLETKKLIRQKKLTVAKALQGDTPKKYSPPRKTITKILDIVAEAQPEIDGDSVNVSIPIELYKQLFAPEIDLINDIVSD
ncbi:ParB/RepB/Spo0J family partition protein [Xenorhabdus ishibashii]|uniref:Chromosome partitioning protein ParB n=1 Tax=Xenorhabdus ishibashii TaxID=1034471 RepID=A0A2D0K822_9GAMM|nr:ParB/RepB/Spo0J family partition protein [Xenorhabdus ishibashii]PHM59525.1 chromosome partitioning protein ParB [Xenorhabdus ishibashii]